MPESMWPSDGGREAWAGPDGCGRLCCVNVCFATEVHIFSLLAGYQIWSTCVSWFVGAIIDVHTCVAEEKSDLESRRDEDEAVRGELRFVSDVNAYKT